MGGIPRPQASLTVSGMRRTVRTRVVPLVAGLLVLSACGRPEAEQATDSLAATADRLAEQTAAGDDCAAVDTAAQLRTRIAEDQQLSQPSREKVGQFLDTLAGELVCEPAPEPEPSQTPTVEQAPDDKKEDNPGKGKGRGGRGDDDDDEDDD